MKAMTLTTEWLGNWKPGRTTEVADKSCPGLLVRGGPSGVKTFYLWVNDTTRDEKGRLRRKRQRLGHWDSLSLPEAQAEVLKAKGSKRSDAAPSARLTVRQLAERYQRDVLSHRERGDEAWESIRLHIVEARPNPKRPAFGDWVGAEVEPMEVGELVRLSASPRAVERPGPTAGETVKRQVGGPGIARAVLCEVKGIFAHAVGNGWLRNSPAAVLQRKSLGLPKKVSRARYLKEPEIKSLFAALDLTALLDGTAKARKLTPAIRLGVAFLLHVPVRSHSLLGARWEEINWKARTWTVPVARLKMQKADRAKSEPFVVPLPATALAILERLKDQGRSSPWILASPRSPDKADKKATPKHIGEKALVRALARLQDGERLKLGQPVTVHDLRRTWRSLAMDLGVDHAVARLSLGHAGLEGVEGVYGRSQMVPQRAAAAELVAAALDRIRLGKDAPIVPLAEARGEGRRAR
jgi:integrase